MEWSRKEEWRQWDRVGRGVEVVEWSREGSGGTVKVHTRHTAAGSKGTHGTRLEENAHTAHGWKRRPIFAVCCCWCHWLLAAPTSQLKTPTSVGASSSHPAIALQPFLCVS